VTLGAALRHEEARLAYADPSPHNGRLEDGHRDESREKSDSAPLNGSETNYAPKASRIPGFLRNIINPERNSLSALYAKLDQFYHTPQEPLPVEIQKRAFFNPAVTSPTPVIWIVRDDMGLSEREIRDTKKACPELQMTDEQAVFNEKGKVFWKGVEDGHSREAPVYDDRIMY